MGSKGSSPDFCFKDRPLVANFSNKPFHSKSKFIQNTKYTYWNLFYSDS